jgi:hypothetical protein
MAYLGIGTFSSSSTEFDLSAAFPSIGSTIYRIQHSADNSFSKAFPSIGTTIYTVSHSVDNTYSYPRDIVGLNTIPIISFATTFSAYSAPFTVNSGVTTNVTFSGISSFRIDTTEQIDINAVRPMWKSYIFVGVSARPTFGQIYPR